MNGNDYGKRKFITEYCTRNLKRFYQMFEFEKCLLDISPLIWTILSINSKGDDPNCAHDLRKAANSCCNREKHWIRNIP